MIPLHGRSAFTLVELLCVLAVGGILLAMAIPNFNRFVVRTRLRVDAGALYSMVRLARSEAINRGQVVGLCPLGGGRLCGEDWHDGVLLSVEGDPLKVLPRLPQYQTLRWFSSLSQNRRLQFSPSGFTQGQNGHFLYCDDRLELGFSIVVGRAGRARLLAGTQCIS